MSERTRSMVLDALRANGPLFGLEIYKKLDGKISLPTLHITLYHMENKKLVGSYIDLVTGRRKYTAL